MAFGSLRRLTGLGSFSPMDFARYLLEFVIVFVGVYLAFLLTDYQEELREREVRVKYYENLIYEFQSLVGHLGQQEQTLLGYQAVLEEIEKGNRPLIPVSTLTFLFSGGVVDAAFEGANFSSLDSRVLANIVRGRPYLEALDQRISMLNQLTASLVPLQISGERCCYDENGRLFARTRLVSRTGDGGTRNQSHSSNGDF